MFEKLFKLKENHTTAKTRNHGRDHNLYDHGLHPCRKPQHHDSLQ